MQSVRIYFTYVQSLHVSDNTLPIIRRSIRSTNQHMVSDRKIVVMIPDGEQRDNYARQYFARVEVKTIC